MLIGNCIPFKLNGDGWRPWCILFAVGVFYHLFELSVFAYVGLIHGVLSVRVFIIVVAYQFDSLFVMADSGNKLYI